MDMMFVREKSGCTDLSVAASRIFASLGLEKSEERESLNRPEGFYFLGHASNGSVEVSFGDGLTLPEFPFWVSMSFPRSWAQPVAERLPESAHDIATLLARHGFDVFVPEGNWAMKDWETRGKLYAL